MDFDRTLLYVGQADRQVYRDVFAELVGCLPERLPATGTGQTVPLAVAEVLTAATGIDDSQAKGLDGAGAAPARSLSYQPQPSHVGQVEPEPGHMLAKVAAKRHPRANTGERAHTIRQRRV